MPDLPIGADEGRAEFLRHQIGLVEDAEPFADQPVFADAVTENQCHVVGLADQLESLHIDLPARQIQRGKQLLVRRRRGVGQERLTECIAGQRVEILVTDVDHRRLPKRRQRLVGGVCRIDPDPRPTRVGKQPVVNPLRSRNPPHRVGPTTIFRSVFRRCQRLLKSFGRDHGRALPGPRHRGGKRIPRLVPQEADVRLDRQHLFHDASGVVHDTVEGAVGEQQHAHPVQLSSRLEIEQRLFDRVERNGPIDGELRQRIRIQVERIRAGQHQTVVVRLVAVAVDQHDVAGAGQ